MNYIYIKIVTSSIKIVIKIFSDFYEKVVIFYEKFCKNIYKKIIKFGVNRTQA